MLLRHSERSGRKEVEWEEESKVPKLELEGDYEVFGLDIAKPDKTVKIGKDLPIDLKMKLMVKLELL